MRSVVTCVDPQSREGGYIMVHFFDGRKGVGLYSRWGPWWKFWVLHTYVFCSLYQDIMQTCTTKKTEKKTDNVYTSDEGFFIKRVSLSAKTGISLWQTSKQTRTFLQFVSLPDLFNETSVFWQTVKHEKALNKWNKKTIQWIEKF